MNDSLSFGQPLVTSAIGFLILGTCILIFAFQLLTRKSPLVIRGNYALVLFVPSLIFMVGTNALAISLSPMASLPYYALLLLISGIMTVILARISQTIVLIGIKKKLIGDMFPLSQNSSVAHLRINKWMDGDQYIIESPKDKWEVNIVGRSAMMTVRADKKVTASRFNDVTCEIKEMNTNHFTSKGATIYLFLGVALYLFGLAQILFHHFLFS
ncbi:MAG: hypothetical protein RIC80_11220 [Cyclobacteriaceae bacterium]